MGHDRYYRDGVELREVTLNDRHGVTLVGLDITAAVLPWSQATTDDDTPWTTPDTLDVDAPGIAVIGVRIGDGATWDLAPGRYRVWIRADDTVNSLRIPERRPFEVV